MKILIVSWYFPPFNTIGAVRVGKFARFLLAQGHDVRILSGTPPNLTETLPLEIDPSRIVRTPWIDVSALPRTVQRWRKKILPPPRPNYGVAPEEIAAVLHLPETEVRRSLPDRLLHAASSFYLNIVSAPDAMAGWVPFAVARGRKLCRDWKPDLIYASGPPFSTFLVADRLARSCGAPWVAEYRDRWVDDPYFNNWPSWRKRILTRLERRLMSRCASIVTVSEPWAQRFGEKFGKQVSVAMNGFDPRDFPLDEMPMPPLSRDKLTILYSGSIYAGKRDPAPLFKALKALGDRRRDVQVIFLGTKADYVTPLAAQFGVTDTVEVRPAVPYLESIRMQCQADVLLLLQWDGAEEQGHTPAKLFEYIGAMRPILGIGLEDGVPANIIRRHGLGLFTKDPELIRQQIETWLDEKQKGGALPDHPTEVRIGFERDNQYKKIEILLEDIAAPAH